MLMQTQRANVQVTLPHSLCMHANAVHVKQQMATKTDLIQNHKIPTQLVIIIPQTLLGDALEA